MNAPALPHPKTPVRRPAPRRGFALIVVMTLLALVVLMILSLVTMVQLSLQASKASVRQAQAQQNALLGVQIAMGQLAKFAGGDQRATGTADLARISNNQSPMDSSDASTGLPAAGILSRASSDPSQLSGLTLPPTLQGGTRYWTGVWGNAAKPSDMYGYDPARPTSNIVTARPVLLAWLVSGNENVPTAAYAMSPTATSFNGQIASVRIPQTFTPNLAVQNLNTNITALSNVTINNLPAVVLVGPNSAGNSTAVSPSPPVQGGGASVGLPAGGNVSISATARYVIAPLVTIQSDTSIAGRYAWWVGDEGLKAKYNVRDPYLESSNVTTQPEARYRFAAQRFGIEAMTGGSAGAGTTSFTSYGNIAANVTLSKVLDRVFSPKQAHSVDNSQTFTPSGMSLANDPMRLRYHDITTYSFGVLSDTLRGGLRYDLTTALEQNAVYNDTANGLTASISQVPGGAAAGPVGRNLLPDTTNVGLDSYPDYGFPAIIPRLSMANVSLLHGPTWDQVRSFYQLNLSSTNTAGVPVRPVRDMTVPTNSFKYQSGISPVIVDARLMFTTSINAANNFFIHTQVAFILGNPYSFPILAPSGLDLSYSIDRAHSQEWGMAVHSRLAQNSTAGAGWPTNFTRNKSVPAANWPYFPILKNSRLPADNEMSVLDNVTFRVPGPVVFGPGQLLVYSMPSQNIAPLSGVVLDPSFKNVYTKSSLTGSGPGGQHVINLVSGMNPDSFFTTATGQTLIQGDSRWGYLIRMLPVKGVTLQMRMATSLPGTQVLQTVINADGTAAMEDNARPNYFLQWYGGQDQPVFANGYVMTLSLPATTVSVPASNSTANFTARYRTYADYNLRATNMVLPPVSQFNDSRHLEGQTVQDTGALPTAVPYKRFFIRTAGEPDNTSDATTYFDTFTLDMLSPKWGRSSVVALGQSAVALFTLPQRAVTSTPDAPLLSLGQLQHLDLTADDFGVSVSYQPAYALGNSWFTPYVSRGFSRQDRIQPTPNNRTDLVPASSSTPVASVTTYDISYLLNTALWDRYYFSTIPQPSAVNGTAVAVPANSRLKFAAGYLPTNNDLGAGASNSTLTVRDPRTGQTMPKVYAPASYQMIDGPFNVNSTSVEAWKALLSGLRNLQVARESANNSTPFPRQLASGGLTANGTVYGNFTTFNPTVSAPQNTAFSYVGFRRLSDAEIARLAVQIVREVRARGPFLSLSQFVNRRLLPVGAEGSTVDPTTRSGPLQSAIDSAALNNLQGITEIVDKDFPKAYADPARATEQGNRSAGIPGWLTQADLLQALGPVLTVRSDTFVIRAYGEGVDPLTGGVASRAWCEAVVQRLPEFYDSTDTPDKRLASLNMVNKTFGRKFRLVTMQWLNPNDI